MAEDRVACNFNYCIENEGIFKVLGNHIHCKNGNVWVVVDNRDVVTADCS